jgi:hypothetical protein
VSPYPIEKKRYVEVISNIRGNMAMDKGARKCTFYEGSEGVRKHGCTRMDVLASLSRRKQGFESPRERQNLSLSVACKSVRQRGQAG